MDAASLYFRAFLGIPESAATRRDGTPVNAVRGFLDMLATLIRTPRGPTAWSARWTPTGARRGGSR